jgi:endonuclease YncB( thermonuclease family)
MLRICAVFVLSCLPFVALAAPEGKITVIDADTWDVGSDRVRLFGIDAPEIDQTCEDQAGKIWTCGAWVTAQVKSAYEGKFARCDKLDVDRYGRIVARCHVDGMDAGRLLVSDGLAFAYRRYSMDYDLDEKAAAVNARGLHASRVQEPAAFRASRSMQVQPSRQGCGIKGNISSGGVRIYHLPGQEHYAKTRISTSRGERWFCSEVEAQAAGWRRARR